MILLNNIKSLPKYKLKQVYMYGLSTLPLFLFSFFHLFFYYALHVFEINKLFSFDRFEMVEIKFIKEPVVKKEIIMIGKDFYYIAVDYTYEFSGVKYKNNRVSFGNMAPENVYNSKYKIEMEKVRDYILKSKRAYIDPKDPSYSVLIPKNIYQATHIQRGRWYALDIGMICGIIASFIASFIVAFVESAYERSGNKMNEYLIILPVSGAFFITSVCVSLIMR